MSSHDDGFGKTPYTGIQQKIYGYAKEFGCEELIVHEKSLKQCLETVKFEGEEMHYVDAYDENVIAHHD